MRDIMSQRTRTARLANTIQYDIVVVVVVVVVVVPRGATDRTRIYTFVRNDAHRYARIPTLNDIRSPRGPT